ncbi:unnamed protein product, partial [Didymodactylos carnosus]
KLASTLTFPLDIYSIGDLIEQCKEYLKNEEEMVDSTMKQYIEKSEMAVDYVMKMRDKHSVYCTQLELSSTWELYIQTTILGLCDTLTKTPHVYPHSYPNIEEVD